MMREPQPRRLFGGGQAPRKIAVFRALQLGDMLCAVPALRALRAAAPMAHITLIGLPWATTFVKRFGMYFDDLLVFPGFPAFPEQPAHLNAVPHFLAEAQRQRFDLAIQLHGNGSLSNPLTVLFAAERCAGFHMPGQYCPDPRTFLPWEEREHEVLRNLRLAEFLGAPRQGDHLEFPLSESDYRALQRCHIHLPAPGSYVCIHPGARLPSRRWLPQRFAEVADRLAAGGMRIVLTGSQDEAEVVRAVRGAMRMPSLDLCGKTDLGAMGALLAQARLVVTNDTGISHIAAAVATPSVVVSCGADPARWAPLDNERHLVISADTACRPCAHHECPTAHECAEDIGADVVAAMAARVIGNWEYVPSREWE
ncbi:glycosyltransferase family 9 protein [Noviherbaspirillum sp.]|uniref:glycosyltransferase family 9 protein n=1 Tax=Noviherbaspirillum sp. TaxID=1926288 RepID=UPI002D65687E|nr:glycosyltransferase family 9 protein [Noviherbaspirillum sp.]HZW21469.1 glycosyltransferase family 9 protein [Noviherbaspirillum sp.]